MFLIVVKHDPLGSSTSTMEPGAGPEDYNQPIIEPFWGPPISPSSPNHFQFAKGNNDEALAKSDF